MDPKDESTDLNFTANDNPSSPPPLPSLSPLPPASASPPTATSAKDESIDLNFTANDNPPSPSPPPLPPTPPEDESIDLNFAANDNPSSLPPLPPHTPPPVSTEASNIHSSDQQQTGNLPPTTSIPAVSTDASNSPSSDQEEHSDNPGTLATPSGVVKPAPDGQRGNWTECGVPLPAPWRRKIERPRKYENPQDHRCTPYQWRRHRKARGLMQYVVHASLGEDVAQKVQLTSRQVARQICTLGASGMIMRASLRLMSQASTTDEGRFPIVSLAAIYRASSDKFRVCLAGLNQKIIAGDLGGPSIAAAPFEVIHDTFETSQNDPTRGNDDHPSVEEMVEYKLAGMREELQAKLKNTDCKIQWPENSDDEQPSH